MADKVSQHKELCLLLNQIYEAKNRDYGDSFHLSFIEEGVTMARIRLSDKLNRFKTLTRDPDTQSVKDESIQDTLLDLANYALMTVLELVGSDRNSTAMNHDETQQSRPVCIVQHNGDEITIMHGNDGYYINSEKCVLCDLCMYGDAYPKVAPCQHCRHYTGDSEKFMLRV